MTFGLVVFGNWTVADWHSESFMSSYGTPTDEELAIEKANFSKLNRLILVEKIKWMFQHLFAKKK